VAIALDATYSTGPELSGVGVYSHEILFGLAGGHPGHRFRFCYRPHRFVRSLRERLPGNASRCLLGDTWWLPGGHSLFHGLNQRMPRMRMGPAVCTFHDLFVMTGDYSTGEFRSRFSEQARDAAERSDLIIAVSSFTAAQVRDLLGVEASRLRVIHHGVRALPAAEVERQPVVLSVGTVQARKNTGRLVEAFEQMPPPWRLVLAGSPSGYGAGQILARIDASPARDRIRVTGYVSTEELARLYGEASVFAFPSLDEGFGMPVLEAMSCGVPVVASDRSALPEICGDAALLVDPSDVATLAEALLRAGTHSDVRRDLTARGKKRAATFTWAAAVEATWNVYRELLT
jgi:glycosyltransferase involved in cell wall biosynthesis